MNQQQIVRKLSRVGILGNLLLASFKLAAGIFGGSRAMISDAVHSLSDVFATLVAYFGTKISARDADADHPYGHERFECVASLILGLILAGTGIGIGWSGIRSLVTGTGTTVPTVLPLIAAIVSIAVKEAMFHYTMHYAKILNSAVFRADAWHHRSDAISSIGSLIGIVAARLGFPFMDAVAAVLICLCILKVAFDVLKDALNAMTDTACPKATEQAIRDCVLSDRDVLQLDLLHTRMFGSRIYVDIELSVRRDSSLLEAHAIAERVHHSIEQNFPSVKHVMVHVNPLGEGPDPDNYR